MFCILCYSLFNLMVHYACRAVKQARLYFLYPMLYSLLTDGTLGLHCRNKSWIILSVSYVIFCFTRRYIRPAMQEHGLDYIICILFCFQMVHQACHAVTQARLYLLYPMLFSDLPDGTSGLPCSNTG